jgi:hypothetical protein
LRVNKYSLMGAALGLFLSGVSIVSASAQLPKFDMQKPAHDAPFEEKRKYKEELLKHAKSLGIKHLKGEITKGAEIEVGNRKLKLPNDAYLDGLVVSDHSYDHDDLPAYIIKRGSSKIKISVETGKIIDKEIAAGESTIFEFLGN